MSVWFEYYLERDGVVRNYEDFERVFSIILWNQSTMMGSNGNQKQVTLQTALRSFHEYYSKKFDL